jgi:hypothetical protein
MRKFDRFEDLADSRMAMFDMLSSIAELEYEFWTESQITKRFHQP